ncbi:MAG: 6-phosphogluconolactonase [Hyphomonadaceae bacterium]|nr:6-phosphogluconolactonase [Hyphomonadaceae bacterium]
MITERPFADLGALVEALAAEIASVLTRAVDARGGASLVVTGGATPEPLYRALSKTEAPWREMSITLSDERWVPVDDPASNEGMVRRTLLDGHPGKARFVSLRTADARAAEAAPKVAAAIAAMSRPFDACLLGIGADGHVASLFPGEPVRRDVLVQAVTAPNAAGAAERISLSLGALQESRRVFLLFTGAAKLAAYGAARDKRSQTPLALFLAAAGDRVAAYWCAEDRS